MGTKVQKLTFQTGIDIGSSSIKFVQLSGRDDDFTLIAFDVIKIEDKVEGQKKTLENIARQLSAKEVNLSIAGPSAVVRYIELPKMTDDELASSMKFEAEKYIPFSVKDVILDCQVMEMTAKGKMRVLLAAAKKDAIEERIALVEGAGLLVNLIDCDAFAIYNAFLLNYPDLPAAESAAMMNVGERMTTMNILKGKTIHFTRELQAGGWDLERAISEKMGIGMREASLLKDDPKEKKEEIIEITKPVVMNLGEDIKLSMSYYENQMAAVSVDKIYVSGESASFPGFLDMLKDAVGIECAIWDPTKRLKQAGDLQKERLDSVKHGLAVCVGLAMRSGDDKD